MSLEQLAEVIDDNRSFNRRSYRTTAAVTRCEDFQSYTLYTDDISPSGARLTSRIPHKLDEVYLLIMMPELKQRMILGKVVREDEDDFSRTYSYAIQFLRMCEEEEMQEVMKKAEASK